MSNDGADTQPLLSPPVEVLNSSPPSLLSRLTLWWVNGLVWSASTRTLDQSDLYPLRPEESTASASEQFNVQWAKRSRSEVTEGTARLEARKGSYWAFVELLLYPGLVRTLFQSFRPAFLFGALLTLAKDIFQFVSPQLLKMLIGIIALGGTAQSSTTTWNGISVALLMFLVSVSQTLLQAHIELINESLVMRLHSALAATIYRKTLVLNASARKEKTSGELLNLMNNDIYEVAYLGSEFNSIWSMPLEFSLTVYFLWLELGPSMLVGIALLLALLPLNAWITTKENSLWEEKSNLSDERIKVLKEVISGIRVVKCYGWEVPFIGKIAAIREKEMEQQMKISTMSSYMSLLWSNSSFLITLATFAAYIYSSESNILNAQKVFVSMHFFGSLRIAMLQVPYQISSLNRIAIAVRRMTTFLNAEELQGYVTREQDAQFAVNIENGSFTWEEVEKPTLKNINLAIPKGSLVAVVGTVGSGKSSLLSAILGDIERVHGSVNVASSETIAYVAQQAWIQNATLRDNVLFSESYNEEKYAAVLEMCALKPDLAILPGGDLTEIGEKGINLSGGQKQRVALARACYSDASLYLCDDPLSAVDSHVAKKLYRSVFSSKSGYLKQKTRVLVTNNLSYLPQFDLIVVVEDGRIIESGTYHQLVAQNGTFAKLTTDHSVSSTTNLDRQQSVESQPDTTTTATSDASAEAGKLIEDEPVDSRSINISVLMQYIKTITWHFLLSTIVLMALENGLSTGQDIWLAVWSSEASANNSTEAASEAASGNYNRNDRLLVYGLFGIAIALIDQLSSHVRSSGSTGSAIALHGTLLNRIMRAPMRFFDTTPTGRVLGRFQGGIDYLGESLIWDFRSILSCLLSVITDVLLIALKTPILLLLIAPISYLYWYIEQLYTPTSRQLSRLRSAHCPSITTHFDETLTGSSTIRAFGKATIVSTESDRRNDISQRCSYSSTLLSSWHSIRLSFCTNLVELLAALFAVLSRGSVEAGFINLIITNSTSLTRTLSSAVRASSHLEKDMLRMEKINEYCEIEVEADWTREVTTADATDLSIPDGWPERGEIEFINYSVRYRDGLDLVLKEVNLKIGAGEKVGVVGRTGSGKTTMTLALFRVLEAAAGGRIEIDGIDIARLGLHELRHALALIPQDPILFSGTIRSNLDPFGVYRDERLLDALTQCHLRAFVDSTEHGLEHPIAENGSNLSLGQRQLLCLGRALLRKAKILVLDEATASVDLDTDALIQKTIRIQFASCTVITIAHRLHTILDSDRVLVLHRGEVREFDTPTNLLANSDSMFYALARDANVL